MDVLEQKVQTGLAAIEKIMQHDPVLAYNQLIRFYMVYKTLSSRTKEKKQKLPFASTASKMQEASSNKQEYSTVLHLVKWQLKELKVTPKKDLFNAVKALQKKCLLEKKYTTEALDAGFELYQIVEENEQEEIKEIVDTIIAIQDQADLDGDYEAALKAAVWRDKNGVYNSVESPVNVLLEKWLSAGNDRAALAAVESPYFKTEEEKEAFNIAKAIRDRAVEDQDLDLACDANMTCHILVDHHVDYHSEEQEETIAFMKGIDTTGNDALKEKVQKFLDFYTVVPEPTPEDRMNVFLKNLEKFAEIHGTAPGNLPTPNP